MADKVRFVDPDGTDIFPFPRSMSMIPRVGSNVTVYDDQTFYSIQDHEIHGELWKYSMMVGAVSYEYRFSQSGTYEMAIVHVGAYIKEKE